MAKTLTLQDAYILLKLARTANIDEVKQAYRKRAFALHPDLHPDNKNAASEFQKVNEAYVTIISYLDSQAKKKSAKAQFVKTENAGQARQESQARKNFEEARRREKEAEEARRAEERKRKEKEREERIERERKEMERIQARERARREEERRRRLQEEIEKAQKKARQKARQEEERKKLIENLEEKAQEFKRLIIEQMEQARKEREQREQEEKSAQEKNQTESRNVNGAWQTSYSYNASGASVGNKYAFDSSGYDEKIAELNKKKQQDKKNSSQDTSYTHIPDTDIFNDEMQGNSGQKKNGKEHFTENGNSATKEKSFSRTLLKAGAEPLEGIKKGLSTWFKSQIDEELELFFPASKLKPGVKMRLQFRVGLASELHTIELTLPKDFVPGKPLRLKGLGKKIGKWQGDLYLKLQAK